MLDLFSALKRSLLRSGRRIDLLAPASLSFTAWPWLCDLQGHITNARYLDLMAVGRFAWLHQAGLLEGALAHRYVYIVAGTGITYRREIRRLAAFTLQTRVAAFDARWLSFEYSFLLPGPTGARVAARAFTRGQVQQRRRACSPVEALNRLRPDANLTPPPVPGDFQAWLDAQEASVAQVRALEGR